MTWLTPGFSPGDADADIAGTVLGGGRSSRLYKSACLRETDCQAVSAGQSSAKLTSMFEIQVTASRPYGAGAEAAINEELVKFRNEGPTARRS
jgi:zinc protease